MWTVVKCRLDKDGMTNLESAVVVKRTKSQVDAMNTAFFLRAWGYHHPRSPFTYETISPDGRVCSYVD